MTPIEDLLQVMKDLRNPDGGCPWDIRQTSQSIAGYTLDETHELIDAIERDDLENLKEELGDLLFNIVFHARIAEENGAFDFHDVAQEISNKMRRRHPHVFGEGRHRQWTDEELAAQWQAAKRAEKEQRKTAPTNGLSTPGDSSNSAIYHARQLQQQAAELGFDWPDIDPVFDKLQEELTELREAYDSGDRQAIAAELGDVMFVCVNLARHARVNAEMSLRKTNRKFEKRFAYVRQRMQAEQMSMTQDQLEQMERFWQEAKQFDQTDDT